MGVGFQESKRKAKKERKITFKIQLPSLLPEPLYMFGALGRGMPKLTATAVVQLWGLLSDPKQS